MKFIDTTSTPEELTQYLDRKSWLVAASETVQTIEKAGEGNMNVVLRIRTGLRSFVLKQSRPYVQKYPQIPAPIERIDVEFQFYQTVAGTPISNHLPTILAYDPEEYIILMEDLGTIEDYTRLYAKRSISQTEVQQLINILDTIHQQKPPTAFPPNLELRQLNHQHIFVLPFLEDNGFQLDAVQAGLQELSLPYKRDAGLKTKVEDIGRQYLSPGSTLLHGDYYPGSWMKGVSQLYVLDPEFSFVGFPEYDLGVMAAHLILITGSLDGLETIGKHYTQGYDPALFRQMAGIEMMRRLIGLAQLPLARTLDEKEGLLQLAHQLIQS